MLFNSYIFILFFLPTTIIGYFGLNRFGYSRAAKLFLLVMSLWFCAYLNYRYLIVVLISIAVNYGFYLWLLKISEKGKQKTVLIAAVVFNVALLGYFKYRNFFADTLNTVFSLGITEKNILLPLGISFYTFQQIAFIVDAYKGEIPQCSFEDYSLFITFFPQLIQGPILKHDELIPQFYTAEKKINWENMYKGMYLFAVGLAKKVLLADTFGAAANIGFSFVKGLDGTHALISMLAYTLEIYFDFSGYSDMAVGIGKMFNFELPVNFNSPYKAITVNDFWKRWHISLTKFFTRYIYIPLGGNRKGTLRTYANIMIVYLVSGLWHGAGWNFVFWGALHGILCVASRTADGIIKKIPAFFSRLFTFIFVNLAWVFFRADSFSDAILLIGRLFNGNYGAVRTDFAECFYLPEFRTLFMLLGNVSERLNCSLMFMIAFFMLALFIVRFPKNACEKAETLSPSTGISIVTIFLAIWSIVSFSGVNTFIYFEF